MSKHEKYTPRHRATPGPGVPTKALRTALLCSSVAVAATGATVGNGVLAAGGAAEDVRAVAADLSGDLSTDLSAMVAERREQPISRSDRRDAADPGKSATLANSAPGGEGIARTEDLSDAEPREIGRALLDEFGFGADQFGCLDALYVSESNWRVHADNPTSSAYGIPQALTQTHDLPAGYMTSAEVQIRWGLKYIADRYGTPCSAWSFKQSHNWY